MFKFVIILVSLLMIIFGGLFFIGSSSDKMIKNVKHNFKYNSKSSNEKIKIDTYINNIFTVSFIAFVFGICLFIASLFL